MIGQDGLISKIWAVNGINTKLTQVNMFLNEMISQAKLLLLTSRFKSKNITDMIIELNRNVCY